MTSTYYPEMDQARPQDTQIDARIGHYGDWFLTTRLKLKGRGIKFLGTLEASQLVPQAQHKAGERQYKVTDLAFAKLEKQYRIACETLL